MLIRQHRSTLSDALETTAEIEPTIEAIRRYFNKDCPLPHFYDGEIKVEHYGYDERIHWDTYIITCDGNAIGFCNSELKGE